jgi:hypothetical protein
MARRARYATNSKRANNRSFRRVVPKRKKRALRSSRPTTTKPTLGSRIRTAVNNILTYIPGSETWKAIADFGFTALKIPASVSGNGTDVTVGVNAVIGFKRFNLINNSPDITMVNNTDIRITHHYSKVNSMTVTLKPQNKAGNRQGYWAMAFFPCSCEDYYSTLKADLQKRGITYEDLVRCTGSVYGPETQTLTLNYRPTPYETYNYQLAPWDRQLGFLAIAYQNTSEEVKADVFSASLHMYGDVEKLVPMMEYIQRSLAFDVLYKSVRHFELRENGNLRTIMKSPEEVEQEEMRERLRALACLEIDN